MNLKKLFDTQKILRDRINYNKPDRFNKLILALLVEIGECANEWRGFKFWSKDQEPRLVGPYVRDWGEPHRYNNPLLEEYVDGLHFVLELGIEIGQTPIVCDLFLKADDVNKQFLGLFSKVGDFAQVRTKMNYHQILEIFIGLGEMLGFTWEQIEQAYFEKNQINHRRQDNGY